MWSYDLGFTVITNVWIQLWLKKKSKTSQRRFQTVHYMSLTNHFQHSLCLGKLRSSKHLQEQYKDMFSPHWGETRSAVVRCCSPWDRSLSSRAVPGQQHPSGAAAVGGSDVSALIHTLLASHLSQHLKRAFPCFISWAVFSQVHCPRYRPDQRKIKNSNNNKPKPVMPLCTAPLI